MILRPELKRNLIPGTDTSDIRRAERKSPTITNEDGVGLLGRGEDGETSKSEKSCELHFS
jgi:hypothetical protein